MNEIEISGERKGYLLIGGETVECRICGKPAVSFVLPSWTYITDAHQLHYFGRCKDHVHTSEGKDECH